MTVKTYEVYVKKGRPWWKIISGLLFSNLGLFFLCIAYAALGAYIFILMELPNEELNYQLKLARSEDVNEALTYLRSIFWQYAHNPKYNFSREQFTEAVTSDLNSLKMFVVDYYNSYSYDMTDGWNYAWTFPKALLFTLTIMTTIGYGHIAPKTPAGQIFCMVYAIIGVPLMLVFSASIGHSMSLAFRWAYSRVCCRWCRVKRREAENAVLSGNDSQAILLPSVSNDDVGKENYMPTDLVQVPIMVNLMLIFAFLFGGAVAFANWEGWEIGSAFYFCFITLATIGFGDLVPQNSFFNYMDGFGPMMQMIFTLAYIIFGMALISMCLQLMQEQILSKISWLAAEIGISSSDPQINEELIKVTKEDRLKQTPKDLTGNELDFNRKRRKKDNNNDEINN